MHQEHLKVRNTFKVGCGWQVAWVLWPCQPSPCPAVIRNLGVTHSIISVPLFTHTAPSPSFFWVILYNALTALPRQRPISTVCALCTLEACSTHIYHLFKHESRFFSGSSWCRQWWFSMRQSWLWLKVVALFLCALGCLLCNILIWSFEVFTILKHTLMLALFVDRSYLSEKKYFLSLDTENYIAFLENN